jgi:hypothetical protein
LRLPGEFCKIISKKGKGVGRMCGKCGCGKDDEGDK